MPELPVPNKNLTFAEFRERLEAQRKPAPPIDHSKDGFYVVEVEIENERLVAERCGASWMPTGCDYDC